MQLVPTPFKNVYEVRAHRVPDARGVFTKLFQDTMFGAAFDDFQVGEIYSSTSARGTVRGLHFQIPPATHHKLIFCLRGKIFDVCLDVRRSSTAYGRHLSFELAGGDGRGVLIPKGCAHGFQALEDDTMIVSIASAAYAPEHERGVAWDACGIAWPIGDATLSDKDQRQPPLAALETFFP